MRWWPPLLHLGMIGAVAVLALLRFQALEVAATVPGAAAVADADAARPAQDDGGGLASGPLGTEVDLAALTERPLFLAGRQPVAGVAATESPAPAPAAESPVFRMLGYLNDGSRPRAIMSLDAGSPEVIVREGEEIQGVTITRISRDAVVLRSEGKEMTIKMFGQ